MPAGETAAGVTMLPPELSIVKLIPYASPDVLGDREPLGRSFTIS
jgi:hypothetical protein